MADLPALTVTTLEKAPELEPAVDELTTGNMPVFMSWESPGNWRWHRLYDTHPAHQICVLDEEGRLVAAANGLPVSWDGTVAGLPGGSDDVLVSAFDGPVGARPDTLCMLSVSVSPRLRGTGLAERLLGHARDAARGAGLRGVVIPVRPTRKARYPLVPMAEYARWRRPDGTPFDPWLATHAALGAELLAPCDRSLVISQPAARWEEVTGHPLPGPARHLVPGALAPLEVSADGQGVYAEPNFWVFHPADPTYSVHSVHSACSACSVHSAGPVHPTDSVQSAEPVHATDSVQSAFPVDPRHPPHSAVPCHPAHSVDPAVPAVPCHPAHSAGPFHPSVLPAVT